MGCGPSFQEALDPLRKSGVYVRRWSRVDTYKGVWRDNEFTRRRSGAGLYVLALLESIALAGSSNRATITASREGMSARLG